MRNIECILNCIKKRYDGCNTDDIDAVGQWKSNRYIEIDLHDHEC